MNTKRPFGGRCPPSLLVSVTLLIALQVCRTESARSAQSGPRPDRECRQIEGILKAKGFTYPWWDVHSKSQSLTPSGCEVAGKVGKCCQQSFDTPSQRREMSSAFSQNWYGSKLQAAGEVFKVQKTKFDTTFKALLQRAHTDFHSMFERTYGMLYIQHAHVFHALFTTLEKYYDEGRDPLESKLNEFFAILTRKMFEVLNAQYDFSEPYLSCATIVISEKQGNDLHRQIVSSLRRSFVATRALAQGLQDADRVINNLQKLDLNPTDCLVPLSQMLHCPVCIEQRAYKPCQPFCSAITAKCLAPTAAMAKPWTEFSKALEDIIDRLLGPYNVEAVVEPIHIKISEAIMNFQESGADLSQAVFSKCGKPTLKSRNFNKRESGPGSPAVLASTAGADKDSAQPSKSLEKLLRDTKSRVKKSRDLWTVIPRQVCNAISKEFSSQLCWNGTGTVKPDKTKGNNNEEESGGSDSRVAVSGRSSNPLVAEQVNIIQVITEKLKTAFNGGDVQWVQQQIDLDDDFGGSGMGSGSGEIPTDLEDSDDDDPSGQITHHHPNPVQPPDHDWKPSTTQTFNPPTTSVLDNKPSSSHPSFPSPPSGTPPPIFRPLPTDDEDEDEEEEEDEDDDDDGNLNIDSRGNDNRRGNTNSGIDFGFERPKAPETPNPATTTTTTTPRPTTSSTTPRPTTTTRRPTQKDRDREKVAPPSPPATSGNSLEDTAGKTVAVVKLFTPVLVSMIGKLFSLS